MTFEAPRMSLLIIFMMAFSFQLSSTTALVAAIKDDNATLTHKAPLDDAENYYNAPPIPQIYAAGLLRKSPNPPEEAPGPEETRHRHHHRRHRGRDDDNAPAEAAPGPEKTHHGHRHQNNGEGHRHNHRHGQGRKHHGKHGSHHDQEGHGHPPKMAPGPDVDTQNSGL
ncbi:unnamed protein product [Linum trigynum]|uniref:Uncharacterized protein n=1 Tax=Linum trigynum TaxID=586398 RepID=A0AAV2CK15_9ROSI